jgi:large subunit ribosomal protein L6e
VLILLSGKYRGKRVVFLKQLDSGLLLVTGPYKVNGVPLKRVNQVKVYLSQAYVIPTKTSVSLQGTNFDKINDQFFDKIKAKQTKKS